MAAISRKARVAALTHLSVLIKSQTNVTAAGECLIDTTQPACANAWCDENRVERDVDYDGPLAPVSGSWSASVTDAEVRCEGHVTRDK